MTNLNDLAREAGQTSRDHGFRDEYDLFSHPETAKDEMALRNFWSNKMLLFVSEVTEAHDDLRDGHSMVDDWTEPNGKPRGVPSEFADVIIRVLELSDCAGIDIEEAVQKKMAYNASRPFMHGRKF